MTVEDRGQVLTLVTEAVAQGSRQHTACEMVGVAERTLQRWQRPETAEDGRRGPRTAPRHTLSQGERAPDGGDGGTSGVLQCESASDRPTPGGPRRIPGVRVVVLPRAEDGAVAGASRSGDTRAPGQAACLRGHGTADTVQLGHHVCAKFHSGQYDYLYLFMDVFSRKAVGAEVHAEESMAHSSQLLQTICREEGIEPHQVSVHADNGGAMKGSTMLATMQRLSVMPSFSRPSVSNDNPFSESLFLTVIYCPFYPIISFANLYAARAWGAIFVPWYNDEHLHSGIRFTTPASRHTGTDTAILHHRDGVYHAAQRTHPSRWSGATRNWTKIARVTLNDGSSRNRAVAKRDRREEPRGREAYLKQYVDRPNGEPACLDAGLPRPGLSQRRIRDWSRSAHE